MAAEGNGFWGSLPGVLTGLAGVMAAVTGLYVAVRPAPEPPQPVPRPAPAVVVQNQAARLIGAAMGPLESGWGYPRDDMNPNGWVAVASAGACSDMCYARPKCRAMTYVVSSQKCWLKFAVPERVANADEVSAVKAAAEENVAASPQAR